MSHSANDKPLVDALQSLLRDVFAEPLEIASSSASVADGGVGAGEDWLDWIDQQVRRSDMTYFVRDPSDLPYMLRGAVERFGNVRRQVYRDSDDIVGYFNRYPTLVAPNLADRTDEYP